MYVLAVLCVFVGVMFQPLQPPSPLPVPSAVDAPKLRLIKQCAPDGADTTETPQVFHIQNVSGSSLSTDQAGLRWWKPGQEPPNVWTAVPGPWQYGEWRVYLLYTDQVVFEVKHFPSGSSAVESCGIASGGVRSLNLPLIVR